MTCTHCYINTDVWISSLYIISTRKANNERGNSLTVLWDFYICDGHFLIY